MSCPKARPIKKADKDISTVAMLTLKSLAILGKAERYMSIDIGSKAVSVPSKTIELDFSKKEVALLFIIVSVINNCFFKLS